MKKALLALLAVLIAGSPAVAATISDTPLAPAPLRSTDKFPLGRAGSSSAYTGSVGQIADYMKANVALSNWSSTSTHRTVTDAEKSTWSGKLDPTGDGSGLTGITAAQVGAARSDTVYALGDYASLQAAVDAVSAAGGGVVMNARGATINISSTFVPKNNVRVDLNGGTLAWTGGAGGTMVENDVTTYGAKFTGMFNGKLDPGANVTTVFKLHSIRSSYYGDFVLISGNTSMVFLHLLADAQGNDPLDNVRNNAYNVFGPVRSDKNTGGATPRVKTAIRLEGFNDAGTWRVVTLNRFVGPMIFFAAENTDSVGYEFKQYCDSNMFEGVHSVTLTDTAGSNLGKCIVFNNSADPTSDVDVWGEKFAQFSCETWNQVSGQKAVEINKAGGIVFDYLSDDRPSFWGSNFVVDNNSMGHNITVVKGNPENTVDRYVKGSVQISGTGEALTLPITGGTQCLQVDTNGVVTGTGSECGTGSGVTPASTVTTQAFGDTGTVGTDIDYAREDHKHVMPANPITASSVTITPSSSSSVNGAVVTRGTPDMAAGSRYNNLYSNLTFNPASPHASSEIAGIESFLAYSGTGTAPQMYAYFASPRNTGVGTVTALHSYQSFPRNTSTGTVGAIKGFHAKTPVNAGTISSSVYGVEVENQGLTGVGDTYGLYIGAQSGSTNPYSIYTGTGLHSFGDALQLRNVTAPSSTTDRVKLYNVEGDYLHVLDEDGNDHTIGQGKINVGDTQQSTVNASKLGGNAASYYATATEPIIAGGTCSTSYNVDMSQARPGAIVTLTLNGACAIGATNITAGKSFTIDLTQSSTTSPTFTSPYKWQGGVAPTWSTSATKYDSVSCYSPDGTVLRCGALIDLR